MRTSSYTDEEIQYIKDNYGKLTAKEIGDSLGRTSEAVRSVAKKKLNLSKYRGTPKSWSAEEEQYLIDNYAKMKTSEIMEKLNRSRISIQQRAKKLGIEKLSAKHDYFKIWTPNMAYVLGLFYADGTMNQKETKISFTLHKDDKYLLEKIQTELESTSKIIKISSSNCFILPIYSKEVKETLIDIGLYSNKSLTIEMPEIPSAFLPHFVRGYFDGDGSINQSNNNPRIHFTCGSKKFVEQLSRVIEEETGIKSKVNEKPFKPSKLVPKGSMSYRLYFNGLNALDLGKWMYQDADLLMKRKYEKYLTYEEMARDKYMKRIEDIKQGNTMNGGYQLKKSASRYFE